MIFNRYDYSHLHLLFNDTGYRGYKPSVVEAPNGDGKLDAGKRYLHVAAKYDPPEWALRYLARAHWEACRRAEALGIPDAFMPRVADGTLRVLDYPPGAGSARHTDFDLFTITCFRSTMDGLVVGNMERPELYFGELAQEMGLAPATPHAVEGRPHGQQSIVYFAMPNHAAVLPHSGGRTVGEWLQERLARSRYT